MTKHTRCSLHHIMVVSVTLQNVAFRWETIFDYLLVCLLTRCVCYVCMCKILNALLVIIFDLNGNRLRVTRWHWINALWEKHSKCSDDWLRHSAVTATVGHCRYSSFFKKFTNVHFHHLELFALASSLKTVNLNIQQTMEMETNSIKRHLMFLFIFEFCVNRPIIVGWCLFAVLLYSCVGRVLLIRQ